MDNNEKPQNPHIHDDAIYMISNKLHNYWKVRATPVGQGSDLERTEGPGQVSVLPRTGW